MTFIMLFLTFQVSFATCFFLSLVERTIEGTRTQRQIQTSVRFSALAQRWRQQFRLFRILAGVGLLLWAVVILLYHITILVPHDVQILCFSLILFGRLLLLLLYRSLRFVRQMRFFCALLLLTRTLFATHLHLFRVFYSIWVHIR